MAVITIYELYFKALPLAIEALKTVALKRFLRNSTWNNDRENSLRAANILVLLLRTENYMSTAYEFNAANFRVTRL